MKASCIYRTTTKRYEEVKVYQVCNPPIALSPGSTTLITWTNSQIQFAQALLLGIAAAAGSLLDSVHTKTCRRLGSSSTLKPRPSPRRRPKQSPYLPYSPVACSTQQIPFLHHAPPSPLPSSKRPQHMMPRLTLLLDLELQLWILALAGYGSRAVGEQGAHSTKKPQVRDWCATCPLEILSKGKLHTGRSGSSCAGTYQRTMGSMGVSMEALTPHCQQAPAGPCRTGASSHRCCPRTQLSAEGCQHSPGSSASEGFAPQTSSLPPLSRHTLFTFTATESCCFFDDSQKIDALTLPLITFCYETETEKLKLRSLNTDKANRHACKYTSNKRLVIASRIAGRTTCPLAHHHISSNFNRAEVFQIC